MWWSCLGSIQPAWECQVLADDKQGGFKIAVPSYEVAAGNFTIRATVGSEESDLKRMEPDPSGDKKY